MSKNNRSWFLYGMVLAAITLSAICGGADAALALNPELYIQQELESEDEENALQQKRWSPYVVGFAIGVLSWLAFLLSDHPLGVSTAYARTAGMIERMIYGSDVEHKAYYKENPPKIDWEWMLVFGLLIGAALSALLSGDFRLEVVPPLWQGTFGHTIILRVVIAVIGGWLIGFGARWAGGCTSGHGISGALQLVLSSWIAALCFFIGGVVSAMFLYYVIA